MSDVFWIGSDGAEHCDVEAALAILLREEVLFASAGSEAAIVLSVNCNDVFGWRCADAEPLPYDEVGNLYRAWSSGPWGVARWCCLRRRQRPQARVEARMRQAGAWDEAVEALP